MHNCCIAISPCKLILLRMVELLLRQGSLIFTLILALNQSCASLLLWKISKEFILVTFMTYLSWSTRGVACWLFLLVHTNS